MSQRYLSPASGGSRPGTGDALIREVVVSLAGDEEAVEQRAELFDDS
jgi:hypothetical protein